MLSSLFYAFILGLFFNVRSEGRGSNGVVVPWAWSAWLASMHASGCTTWRTCCQGSYVHATGHRWACVGRRRCAKIGKLKRRAAPLRQVHADFENIGRAAALSTVCLYGGSPYGPQEGTLRRGCDVVVGTPGRVKDHLERGTLKLQELQCAPYFF